MILNKTPMSLPYVREYTQELDETKPIILYVKKFCLVSKEDADEIATNLRALQSMKIKEEHIVKIVDVQPQDAEDLHKIFVDVSLTEGEAAAILACIKRK